MFIPIFMLCDYRYEMSVSNVNDDEEECGMQGKDEAYGKNVSVVCSDVAVCRPGVCYGRIGFVLEKSHQTGLRTWFTNYMG